MKSWTISMVLAVGLAASTWAGLITPPEFYADTGGGNAEIAAVKDALGLGELDPDPVLIYKDNSTDSGDGTGITTDPDPFNPNTQEISTYGASWDFTDDGGALYAIVIKAGRSLYVYVVEADQHVSSDGMEYMNLNDIDGYDGSAISHVSFYGLPDGGATVLLLGMVLCVGGMFRRRLGR